MTIADALADHERADQGRDTGVDVHHGAARKVQRAEGPDQARAGSRYIRGLVEANSGPAQNQTIWAMGK
jgi:hypothetical protein